MRSVSFKYVTELAFSSPASEHKFLLRILPPSDGRQSIKTLSWRIDPKPEAAVWRSIDGFGNDTLCGRIDAPHGYFRFGIEGGGEVSGEPYTDSGEPPRILLYPTELTRPHADLVELYNDIERSAPINKLERIEYFSHTVHTKLRYERGATTNATTASEAFDRSAGVCQDYAHILLAILRLDKIPCRYVAGMASDYGETHAWVEAWGGEGVDKYFGIDPTRDKPVDENYIAISRGRDFTDCTIERGIFKGACRGTQTVSLSMEVG